MKTKTSPLVKTQAKLTDALTSLKAQCAAPAMKTPAINQQSAEHRAATQTLNAGFAARVKALVPFAARSST